MRTTVTLDDELMATAAKYTGIKERSALIQKAVEEMVQREAGRRLAKLGGSDPTFSAAPRRRPPYFLNPE